MFVWFRILPGFWMKTAGVKKLPLNWSVWSPVAIVQCLAWLSDGPRLLVVREMFGGPYSLDGVLFLWTDIAHLESDFEARRAILSCTGGIDLAARAQTLCFRWQVQARLHKAPGQAHKGL